MPKTNLNLFSENKHSKWAVLPLVQIPLPPLPHPANPHIYKHVRTIVKEIDFTPSNVPTGLSPDNSRPAFMTEFPGCMWVCEATDGSQLKPNADQTLALPLPSFRSEKVTFHLSAFIFPPAKGKGVEIKHILRGADVQSQASPRHDCTQALFR